MGRKRRVVSCAVMVVACGALTASPSAGVAALGDPAERAAETLADLRTHPEWPQRAVTVDGQNVVLRFSAGDPPEYLQWTVDVGRRLDGDVRREYVVDSDAAPSLDELTSIEDQVSAGLRTLMEPPDSVLSSNPEKGRVEVKYEDTSSEELSRLLSEWKAKFGDRFYGEAGAQPQPAANIYTKGGYGIALGNSSQVIRAYCTLGFNVIKNGVYHFLTAAHCVQDDTFSGSATTPFAYQWGGNGTTASATTSTYLGANAASVVNPPYGDMAVIRYSTVNNVTALGSVYDGHATLDITSAEWSETGDYVCAWGAMSKNARDAARCSYITDSSAQVTVGGYVIQGQIQTNIDRVCGDSGGPLWKSNGSGGAVAIGVLSSADTNNCTTWSTMSWYTDVMRAWQTWAVDVY